MLSDSAVQRRLAAILAADVVGYSRLVAADEVGALDKVRVLRSEIIEPLTATHGGHLFAIMGDGFLIEFSSTVQAVTCALAIQARLADRPPELRLRIGVHVGDVVVHEDGVIGDGVNIAVRLEAIAEAGGICMSGRVAEDVAGKLTLDLADLGTPPLKNIDRPIRVFRVGAGDTTPRPALSQQDKPSIAVLPFQNMSGDPGQDYFVDGMVDEIITALSRIRWLSVTARHSTFTHKEQAVDVKQVGRELAVRYVLEGSVRKAGNRVRITGQLIDAVAGTHLWVDRFEGLLENVFELQDKVAASVAGAIEPALQAAEMRRAADRPTNDLTAYDLYLRAMSAYRSLSRRGISDARNLAEQAIERDPDYGPALSMAARCHLRAYLDEWAEDPELERRKGIDRARRALAIGRDDPVIMAAAALVLTEFDDDISTAMTVIDRALEINPSYAHGWFVSGAIRLGSVSP
ncbi:MAG: hypothetical protein ACJ8AW_37065 [Rhodopila sp.]